MSVTVASGRPRAAAGRPRPVSQRRTGLLLMIGALALIVGLVGWTVYTTRIAPLRRPAVTVDGRSLPMDYLIARLIAGGGEPLAMLDTLTREEILAIEAPRPPFRIEVSDADVERYLRRSAAAGGPLLAEADFAEWRRRMLNDSRMSEADFDRTTRAELIRQRMTDRFAQGLPATAPQVHLHMLPVGTLRDAERARDRLVRGEAFAAVAARAAIDPRLRAAGGDAGWLPRAALSRVIGDMAFDRLRPGEVSAPLGRVDAPGFLLVMVSERAQRPVAADAARQIGRRRLDDWLDRTYAAHAIELGGLSAGYDSQTDAWVRQQVTRRRSIGTS